MERPKEIKFKVALQYYSQPFLVCYNIENNPVVETFSGKNIEEGMYEPDVENKRELLILKPLYKITSKDAIDLAKIYWKDNNIESSKIIIEPKGNDLTIIRHKKDEYDSDFMWLQNSMRMQICVFQFLQSRGYDLPNQLLGGKTLKEAGIAIYENEMD